MSDSLRSYLQQIADFRREFMPMKGFAYGSNEEYVLANGQSFEPAPRPKGVRQMTMKMCFRNAYRLVTSPLGEELDLTYVEGYAVGVIPTMHAWAVTPDDKVVDPTWRDGKAYFGVPFNLAFVHETMRRTHVYGILDDWKSDYPLLRAQVAYT